LDNIRTVRPRLSTDAGLVHCPAEPFYKYLKTAYAPAEALLHGKGRQGGIR
jgi:hypothetical protein